MLRKSLLATALAVAILAGPALVPQSANAQVIVQTPGVSIGVGVPVYNGYPSGYYGSNYYNGTGYTGYYYNGGGYNGVFYHGGYRPAYNTYQPYNTYYNQGYYGRGVYGARYGRIYR